MSSKLDRCSYCREFLEGSEFADSWLCLNEKCPLHLHRFRKRDLRKLDDWRKAKERAEGAVSYLYHMGHFIMNPENGALPETVMTASLLYSDLNHRGLSNLDKKSKKCS